MAVRSAASGESNLTDGVPRCFWRLRGRRCYRSSAILKRSRRVSSERWPRRLGWRPPEPLTRVAPRDFGAIARRWDPRPRVDRVGSRVDRVGPRVGRTGPRVEVLETSIHYSRWDSQRFCNDFAESTCYHPPLKLVEGTNDTLILETRFKIENNKIKHW